MSRSVDPPAAYEGVKRVSQAFEHAQVADGRLLYVLACQHGRSANVQAGWLESVYLTRAMGSYFGGIDFLTPSGLSSFEEIEDEAVLAETVPSAARTASQHLPEQVALVATEGRAWWRAQRFRRTALALTAGRRYSLVMQLHARHHDAGRAIARRLGSPYVLRVEALEVSEEADWGLQRPGWGGPIERWGEHRLMRQADLVVPVSAVLDGQLGDAGIPARSRFLLPNGVDVAQFSPGPPDQALLAQHGLEGRFVVGWVGGFRPMHGLDAIPEIARGLREQCPEAVLCLVGNGPLRDELARAVAGLEDTVRLVGAVPHADIPRWLRSFDACLLLAGPGGYHYSPLKLYEYMGCGKPIVAAEVGEVADVLHDQENGLLVPRGDTAAVVDAIVRLAKDHQFRTALGQRARLDTEQSASWEARAKSLVDALADHGLVRAPAGG